jgi:hypothetical protein
MELLVSWIWSLAAGVLTVAFLLMQGGALVAIAFAIVGLIRGRCSWYTPLIWVGIAVVSWLLYKGVFLVSNLLAQDDDVSTGFFWASVLLGLLCMLPGGLRLMWDVWKATYGAPEGKPL